MGRLAALLLFGLASCAGPAGGTPAVDICEGFSPIRPMPEDRPSPQLAKQIATYDDFGRLKCGWP